MTAFIHSITAYQWLSLAISTGLFGACIAFVRNNSKRTRAIALGVQALLRAQMLEDYNKWYRRGYAPIYAKENFENCWKQYESLGANGVMQGVHDEFMALPNNEGEKA